MKRLRTVIMVGLALVVGLVGISYGGQQALAAGTETTAPATVHVSGFGYELGSLQTMALTGGYDLTEDTTFGDMFAKYAIGSGFQIDDLWRAESAASNHLWTPEQFFNHFGITPDDGIDIDMYIGGLSGYAFNRDIFKTLAAEKTGVPGNGTVNILFPDDMVPFTVANLSLNLTYKMADGSAVPEAAFSEYQNPRTITGYPGQVYTDTEHFLIPQIAGYTANTDKVEFVQDEGNETQAEPVTITYTKNPVAQPEVKVPTLLKVYGKQNFYTYKNVDFKKSERIHHYLKKPRTYAPVLDVVGRAESQNGNPRYKLRDGSYITAKKAYVGNLYWQGDQQRLYVTAPKGTNLYQGMPLTNKVRHLKQGSSVQVVKMVKKGYLTRYQLVDGTYITGNKQLASPTKPKMTTEVKAKTRINLYRDVNLQHRIKQISKGQTVVVKGWDYSFGGITGMTSHKRYKVAGGYITANTKLVKIIKH
ncbi:DUF5776 domain-containing protein [Levilactobacillus humaensis]|uniref:DUF5776 domain-containing protein n=1 Tax=Levilactobacillus humaensis TaxID=2950375 RepID=UPI0021C4419A|nr:DUF5776 domain-containing protein [Levilactobacillus humaensis]